MQSYKAYYILYKSTFTYLLTYYCANKNVHHWHNVQVEMQSLCLLCSVSPVGRNAVCVFVYKLSSDGLTPDCFGRHWLQKVAHVLRHYAQSGNAVGPTRQPTC